jgi:hypothetical protein
MQDSENSTNKILRVDTPETASDLLASAPAGRKLRILISLLYYFPHRTGLTIHVQSIAEELVKRGHEVTVVTARYTNELTPR